MLRWRYTMQATAQQLLIQQRCNGAVTRVGLEAGDFRVIFAYIPHGPRPRRIHPSDTSKAPRTGPFLMGRIALLSRKMRKMLISCRLCGPTRTTTQSVAECHKVYYIFNNTYNNGLSLLPWHSETLPAAIFLSRIRRARFFLYLCALFCNKRI